jgi:chloramphenicol 3-O-phosphotransferase
MVGKNCFFNSLTIRVFFVLLLCVFLDWVFVCSKSEVNKKNFAPGKIIFVSGSCSSGKSSMAKFIAQKLDAKSFAFDEYAMPLILKNFITKHYGKLIAFFVSSLVMRNFFTSVNFLSEKQKYKFQMKFYNDLRQGMALEPTRRMYREVKKIALQGENVVVESPLFLWGGVDLLSCLSEFEGVDVAYVLAYCPWNDLIGRIKQRNLSKNKKNHRELDWVLINFVYSLEISPEYRDDSFFECLSGRIAHKTVAEYSQPAYKKKRLCLLPETQHAVLQAFPEKNSYYYIYPKFEYDVVVNTKINTSEQGANLVVDYVKNR